MKKCRTCNLDKNQSEFPVRSRNTDGLDTICKPCKSDYRKKYWVKRKDADADYSSNWKSKEKIIVNCTNCNKNLIRHRTNKIRGVHYCSLECRRKLLPPNYFESYCRSAKKRARVLKLDFDLSPKYLKHLFITIQKSKCAVIGNELTLVYHNISVELHKQASLDRVDNSKGYVKGNVRFVSLGINYMKNRRSDDELFKMIAIIQASELTQN